jgi:trans-2,3-dihydro-3-hydroxyanthranilate isomerase
MERRLAWLDVFTSRPLAGNALAVVHDADDLDDPTMLAFARETRLSETTFVQAASDPGADYRNRIWMTTGELDFAGHPSLGTAVAVAVARDERQASYVQQTRAGRQPIEVELGHGDGAARASMLQEPLQLGPEVDPAEVAVALGLDPSHLHPELPAQVVSTGVAHLLVPLVDEAALSRPHPTLDGLVDLLGPLGATCAYLAVCDPGAGRAQARGFFVGQRTAEEDPATGSAAGPLCAYLHARVGVTHLDVEQGVLMGRPSRLRCEAGPRVRVGGDVVVLGQGTVRL